MAGASRSQVTITLGRSGQVVKRPGPAVDNLFPGSSSSPTVGSKRSVRERLGASNGDINLDNKRQRVDGDRLGLRASNGSDDLQLRKDDLRFKIMKRTQSSRQQNGTDLRELLSRPGRSSSSLSPSERVPESRNGRVRMPESKHIPEPRDIRQHADEPRDVRPRIPEPSDGRQRMVDIRDGRERMLEPRDSRQRMPESKDGRQRMPEPRDGRLSMREPAEVRQRIPDMNDNRHRLSEPATTSMLGRVHSTRSGEALPQLDSMRGSYSPWTLDHIRRRSPDRVLDKSRGLSPSRNPEEPPRRPLIRAHDDLRSPYMSREVHELSRPGASFMSKPSIPTKSMGSLVASQLPPSGAVARSSYPVDDQLTIEAFLHSLGLEKYAITFKVEEVDMHALRQMGDTDLKELGIPMGPRKKILLALLARTRRQMQVR